MGVVGRLKRGDLILTGEVDERLPAITNGLVAHFPFDDTEVGRSYRNLLDTSAWKVGVSGSQGMFGQNGDGNTVVMKENPWGNSEPTWATINNDVTSDADGGWNVTGRPIDNTKKYRLSVWIKREAVGDGTTYFGCQASTVHNLSNSLVNTNPYFTAGKFAETYDNWVLFIGYIHPSSYALTVSDPTNGIYKLDGTRVAGSTDYKWAPTATTGGHRAYLYYSTATTERQYFARPRFEICDGSEASISELLIGQDDSFHAISAVSTTLTPNGIAVEEGTTNLFPNGNFVNGLTGWMQAANATTHEVIYTPHGYSVRVKREDGDGGSWPLRVVNSVSFAAGTTYTWSFKYRVVRSSDPNRFGTDRPFGVGVWGSDTGNNNYNPYNLPCTVVDIGNGWKHLSASYTFVAAMSGESTPIHSMPDYTTVDFADMQLESKPFATSFVNGTRGSGMLSLSNVVPVTGNYTINFKCKLNTTTASTQSYNTIMSMGSYYTNNSWTIMDVDGAKVNGGLGFIRKGNAAEWAWATTSLTPSSDLGKEMVITVTKDDTNYKCYYNGVLKGTIAHVSANMPSLLWIGSRESGGHVDSTEFKELSIYNRSLSVEEVVKLYGKGFSIQKNGAVNSEVTESPVKTSGRYLPLGTNGEDTTRLVSPITETNTVYENGAVWVGKAATNMWTGTAYAYQAGVGVVTRNSTEVVSPVGSSFEVAKLESTDGANFNAILWTVPGIQTPGHKYTHSVYVMLTKGTYVRIGQHWNPWADSAPIYIPKNEWVRISFTTQTDHATNVTVALQYHTDGIAYVTAPQYEYSPYMTPFIMGTRGHSKLTYNTADVIPNVKDFSFFMWVRYQDLSTWQLSGDWGTFYFGPYGNSYLRFSWMENSANTGNVNTQRSASSSGFTVPKNEWVMIGCSVKENAWIDIYANGKRYANFTSPFLLTTAPNFFSFNDLDESSTAYPLNAHIRDAIFIPKAISPVEVEEMYKAQLRSSKGNIIIQGQIKEGEVL